jgi:hypothetical protein
VEEGVVYYLIAAVRVSGSAEIFHYYLLVSYRQTVRDRISPWQSRNSHQCLDIENVHDSMQDHKLIANAISVLDFHNVIPFMSHISKFLLNSR